MEMGQNTAKIRPVDRPEEESTLVAIDRLRRCPPELADEFWPPRRNRKRGGPALTQFQGGSPMLAESDPIVDGSGGRQTKRLSSTTQSNVPGGGLQHKDRHRDAAPTEELAGDNLVVEDGVCGEWGFSDDYHLEHSADKQTSVRVETGSRQLFLEKETTTREYLPLLTREEELQVELEDEPASQMEEALNLSLLEDLDETQTLTAHNHDGDADHHDSVALVT